MKTRCSVFCYHDFIISPQDGQKKPIEVARSFDSLLTYCQLRIITGKKKRKYEKKIRCETFLVRFITNNKVQRRQNRLREIT